MISQRLHRLRDAGVVDQHIDAAEGLQHGRGGGVARGLVGHVGNHAEMVSAELRGGGCRLGAFEVENGDARTMRCHQARSGEPESVEAGAAGDHGNFVFEQHVVRLQNG